MLVAPPIGVVMIVYNHEKYVAESIRSVLDQSFGDFELIIVNDGSIDTSDEIIRSFSDPRIRYLPQENQGPSVATNAGILAAKGKYIALICGDDAWYPHRLQRHYECLSTSVYRMAFSWVDLIDDESRPILDPDPARDSFDHLTATRAEILRANFFANSHPMQGPFVNGVTALVERELFLEAGLYHLTTIQAQDFEMFVRLAINYDLCILPERLVKYRIRSQLGNLSSTRNSPRAWFELYQLYREIFNEVPCEMFREAFVDKLRKPNYQAGIEYELEKAFIYLEHGVPLIRSLANEKLFHLLRDPRNLEVAETTYGLNLRKLYEMNRDVDITNLRAYEELHDWCEKLTEAKEYFLGQLAYKDALLAEAQKAPPPPRMPWAPEPLRKRLHAARDFWSKRRAESGSGKNPS